MRGRDLYLSSCLVDLFFIAEVTGVGECTLPLVLNFLARSFVRLRVNIHKHHLGAEFSEAKKNIHTDKERVVLVHCSKTCLKDAACLTVAPPSANLVAMSFPMPLPAPVTRTISLRTLFLETGKNVLTTATSVSHIMVASVERNSATTVATLCPLPSTVTLERWL